MSHRSWGGTVSRFVEIGGKAASGQVPDPQTDNLRYLELSRQSEL